MSRHSTRFASSRVTVDGLAMNGARYLLLAALALAPWAYGATEPWAFETVNLALAGVFGLWTFACLLRQSWPAVPRALELGALALTGYAWFMALNAGSDYHAVLQEWVPLTPWLPSLPGSVHQSASFAVARRVTALLVAVCFICDMTRHSLWRRRLLGTLALNGASLILFGLFQRLAGAPSIFWSEDDFGKTFFATYRYHSNAGAFINLIWPLVAGFAALAFLRGDSWQKRLAWGAPLLLCLAGVLVNASRAASVLALALGAVWIGWLLWQAHRGRLTGVSPSVAAITGGLLLLLIVAMAAMAGLDTTVRRWGKFSEELSGANPRLQVVRVCLAMLPESGWFGVGPGAWQASFPYFSNVIGDQASGIWEHAHNDYLETLIDWGVLGAAGWALVILGGLLGSCVQYWRQRHELDHPERATHFAVATALAGMLLHSLVDFPLQIASLQLSFAALLGMTWAARYWLRAEDPLPLHGHHRRHRSARSLQPATEAKRSF